MNLIKTNADHAKARERDRRVIINYDAISFMVDHLDGDPLIQSMFGVMDLPGSTIDSVWWNWGEGNFAFHDSEILERFTGARFPKWEEEKFDVVGLCHAETKKRGLESFFSYRLNGSDSDKYSGTFEDGHHVVERPKFKADHPEFCIWGEVTRQGHVDMPRYNFIHKEVRDHKIAILDEAFELYDWDGIEVDFARACPVLTPGHQWELRDHITEFMHDLRTMLEKKAKKRGHPIMIAAKVPETIVGCHFDGFDVEAWVALNLVDILVAGCRSFEIEYLAFHDLVEMSDVQVYPGMDDIHASDGYRNPPIEVVRGVLTNWRHQGFSGLQTFNFQTSDPHVPDLTSNLNKHWTQQWTIHKLVYEELAGEFWKKKKTFVIQRRLGGHQMFTQSFPWDWDTPRWTYHNSNMEAQLPAVLPDNRDHDLLLHMYVGQEPGGWAALNVELSEAVDIEVRVNNCLLSRGENHSKVVLFRVNGNELAEGDNLIGISLVNSEVDNPFLVEKVELEVWGDRDGA